MTAQDTLEGLIAIHDGEKVTRIVPVTYKMIWEDYVAAYGIKEKRGDVNIVYVPEANARFRKEKPLACLFNATKALLQNRSGITLDSDDADFFDEHPLTYKDGVNLPDTARVVQELIEPYNFRVSRIVLAPLTPIEGDLLQWADVLGLNPMALGDLQTTNETFAKLTQQDPAKVAETYRMEFSDAQIRPCVLCAVSPMSISSKTGENLGHAEYAGVRHKLRGKEPTLQLQVERKELVTWLKEPVFPAVDDTANKVFDPWMSMQPDGASTMSSYKRPFSPSSRGDSTSLIPTTYGNEKFECYVCLSQRPKAERIGANLCTMCWNAVMSGYRCSDCHTNLRGVSLRGLVRVREAGDRTFADENPAYDLKVACPNTARCGKIVTLRIERTVPTTPEYRMLQAIRAYKLVNQ